MAIKTEEFEINGKSFTRTYSDMGYMIKGGSPEGVYTEAIDLTSLGRTYEETVSYADDEYVSGEEVLQALENIL